MDIKSLINHIPPSKKRSAEDDRTPSEAKKIDTTSKYAPDLFLAPLKHRLVQAAQPVTLPPLKELLLSNVERTKTEISLCQLATEAYGLQRDTENRAQKITEMVLQPMSRISPPTLNTMENLNPELDDLREAVKKSIALLVEVTQGSTGVEKLSGRKLEYWRSAQHARETAEKCGADDAAVLRHILCQMLRQARQLGDDELMDSLLSISTLRIDEIPAMDCEIPQEIADLSSGVTAQDASDDSKDADFDMKDAAVHDSDDAEEL